MTVAAQLISCEVKRILTNSFCDEGGNWEHFSCFRLMPGLWYVTWGTGLERQAWLVIALGPAEAWSSLWGCPGKHGGTAPCEHQSVQFCTCFDWIVSFGCWVPPSGCFLCLARSFRILLLSSRVFVATLSLLSSGDIISTLSRPSPKSLVKILSSTGHWANPRGASLDSCAWFDSEPSVIALCVSQRVIQAAQCPEDTRFHHWPVTTSCGTGSKSILYLGLIYPLILLPCCRRKLDGLDVICSRQNYSSCQASPWFCSPADCSQLVSGTKVELAASCSPLPFWIGTLFALSL